MRKSIYLISSTILFALTFGCKKANSENFKVKYYSDGKIKSIEEFLTLNGKDSVLNQAIFYNTDNKIDFRKSQFFTLENTNCIRYHSVLDTNKTKIGKNRFIIFKTSKFLKSDFSNIEKIELKKMFFKNGNLLCFNKDSVPKYGVIEDIIFIKSDSIINNEKAVRILRSSIYINLEKSLLE